MNIIFSPEYSGTVYVRPVDGKDVMMDTTVVNTIGLINLLELRLGLHYEEVSGQERVAHYYDALCKYMAAHPQNVMAASFKTAGLGTAKAMLAWREELRGAEWDFDGKEISDRLAVLIGVEEYFRKQDGCDMAGRLHIVTDQVAAQQLDCQDMTIHLAVGKDLLKPTVKNLIEVLESQGATTVPTPQAASKDNNLSKVRQLIASEQKGKITLAKDDDSIQIWKFPDDHLACEYLSYNNMDDVDVWVNADNKQMDNWLMLMNSAQTGSVTADCTPQLTQLFVMGLGMFAHPLNVNTLIEWLNMPVHPIDRFFRSVLADTIVREGGYRNDACKERVAQFVEGRFVYLNDDEKALPEDEQQKIRQKDRKKRQKQVDVFLPSLDRKETIETEKVRQFVAELSAWARQRAHLMAGEAESQWVEQLVAVAGMCDAYHILLGTISEPTVDYKTLDSWMSTVYEKGAYTNAVAERGCRTVVDSPAKIASVAGKTVWIGVDGDTSHAQECAFLYPSEKARLTQMMYMHPWAEAKENGYYEQTMMTPLRMTEGQLILVVRERIGGETTLKHPLIVRLERQVENIEDFVRYPQIGVEHRHEVEKVANGSVAAELQFDHSDKIQWPDHLSPTTIGTLAEHPFDYLMERLLNITNDGKAQMADAKTTKGNVAHAVIEALFAPRDGKRYSKPEEIEARIRDEYEAVYTQILEAKGAVLQLAENRLTEKLLHEQLRSCLDTLLEILKDNGLKVTGCEHYVESRMNLGLPKATDSEGNVKDRDILGFIDMTLEDKDGHPVVFDFKWTAWANGYQEKLSENRSVQLELYRWMLGREKKDQVERVAYFLMPEARLYSREAFKGRHCTQLTSENCADIVAQLRRSAIYRRQQIESGVVETNGIYDELQYVKDTEAQGLFPLKKTEKKTREGTVKVTKEGYFFSQYGLFNNKTE